MTKIAWVFPGQGAQSVGMGQELYHTFPEAAKVFEVGDRILGRWFSKLVFEGPDKELVLTKNAQPALLAVGVACAQVALGNGLSPDMVAGLSLGEYTALVVAGSISLEDALTVTHKRGLYMQEACPEGKGGMAAILGLACAEVEAICYEAESKGIVCGASYNCPGQVVVSGDRGAVTSAMRLAKDKGAKCVPLAVSAPFHSPLMEPAAARLKKDLDHIKIRAPSVPVYTNVDGDRLESPEDIRDRLVKQVTHPVLWQVDVQSMIRDGAGLFVEMGPGKGLTGFLRRISPEIPGITFLTPADLNSIIDLSKEASVR